MTDTTCPSCGTVATTGSKFCESCGSALGNDAPAAPVATEALDELSPISAPTRRRPTDPPVATGPRPCLVCQGTVGPDGYCETCGAKAPTERDHFRETPASWVAGVCDRGIVHHRNEDAMALLASDAPGERAVLVVLDGVSNSIDSDVASLAGAKAARESLRTPFPQGMGTPASRSGAITQVFGAAAAAANAAVVQVTDPASTNPASATFAVAVVERSLLAYANIGDSRVYWLPDGGPGVQLTVDDSAAQQQMESGVPREVAESSPQAHAITKWLGRDAPDVTPRTGQLELTTPGWVVACSDGLWNYASEPDALAAQVAAAGTSEPLDLALALVAFANAQGGRDNITAAVARVQPVDSGQNASAPDHQEDPDG
ncbi:serine/threonine protein phosphatase [Nocardioides sp. Root1257]|uniref:protein phosphatase 2C domain-containing protein n=1 Tax=unclassified Nocardioides TaxID=2615069 RepID=UPI00070180C4|nr:MULTISPECIES: protein phosphatase 2C domain-containing protein [unclassified Nocardioides]KQW53633.1 serine/threonine protein phosphatase [Nocardioides sp. Root1257]KRC56319.1 serine/threonine protein phosphatase [Nocardioides sp. Root224]